MGCNCGGGSKFTNTNQVRRAAGNPPISGAQVRGTVQSADARMSAAKGGAVYGSKVLRKTV